MAKEKSMPANLLDDDAYEQHTSTPKQDAIIELDVRCRDCFHFNRQRAPGYTDICSKLGVLGAGRPCEKYMPDAKVFDLQSDDGKSLRDFIGHIPASRLSLYAALLTREKITRRQGLQHGELVYVRLFRDDYLSNYFRAWVILANARRVFVQGTDGKFRGNFLRDSILDSEQFVRKRKALASRRRLIDPNLAKHTEWRPENKITVDYEPPVLDGVLQAPVANKKKRKDKRTGLSVINMRG